MKTWYPSAQAWLAVNVAIHSTALALMWATLLYESEYANAFAYAFAVNGLRVVIALVAVACDRASRDGGGTLVADRAKLSLVCTAIGGIVTGALLCVRGALDSAPTAVPVLLVGLTLFDPTMGLPVYFSVDASRGATRNGRSVLSAHTAVQRNVRTARLIGTLVGQFLFSGALVQNAFGIVTIGIGLTLIAAQVPLLPLQADGAAARIGHVTLRNGYDRNEPMCMRDAIFVEIGVSLALAAAVATWSYEAVSLWDNVYPSASVAWAVNVVSALVAGGAVWVSRTRRMRIDDRDEPQIETLLASASGGHYHASPPPADGTQNVRDQGDLASPERSDAGATSSLSSPHRPLVMDADDHRITGSIRRSGLSVARATRLRQRLHVFAFVLIVAMGISAILDIALRSETVVHVAVSLAVIVVAIQADQLADQVALLSNQHALGTHAHVMQLNVLTTVRITAYVCGFLVTWFWRDQLHCSTYVFAFLPVALLLATRVRPASSSHAQ